MPEAIDKEGWNEITVSVSANNKVNMGNYESADRTVFLTKKLRMAADIGMEQEMDLLTNETRRLQALAEAENARIVALFCAEAGAKTHEDKIKVFTGVHKAFIIKAKLAFGLKVTETLNPLAKGIKGVEYVDKETGEVFVWDGKGYKSDAAPKQG